MYEVFYPFRDDWGKIYWAKSRGFFQKLEQAQKHCLKLPVNSYVKKYAEKKACFYNAMIGIKT